MVNYEYPPLGGGGGVFNKQLAEELSKENHVTIITSQFRDQSLQEVCNNVEIIRVPVLFRTDQNAATIPSMLSFFPTSLWAGYKLLKERTFDIIHSMFAIPSAPSGLALAKKFGTPHVLSILGGDIYDPSKKLSPHKTPLLHHSVKKIIDESDMVVSLSSDIKKRALQYYKVSRPIHIIHLGIPKPVFKKKSRNHFNFSQNDFLLITVGRLISRKGLPDLINIIYSLNRPNLKLIVVGDGPQRPTLEALAKSMGVADRLFFFGHVTDEEKFQLLEISDVYVSSSRHEGFGIVFLEAMASGLPIACYDNGGQADFLKNNETGFLIPVGNKDLLANRILDLYRNVRLKDEMSHFNRKYITQFYIQACCKSYQLLYDSLIHKS